MKKINLILGLCACAVGVFAQNGATPLTLEQALQTAMAQNPSLQASALEELSAKWKKKESLSAALPQVNATADLRHNIYLPQSFIPSAAFGGPAGEYKQFGAGLQNTMSAMVEVNQVLFNQQLFSGINALDENINLAKLTNEQAKENVAENVSKLYYSLYTTGEQIAIVQQSLNNVTKLATLAEANYKNGLIRKLDYERVLVSKTSLESQLRNIKSAYERISNLLKVLMGVPQSTAISMPDTLLLEAEGNEVKEFAAGNNMSYKILQQQKVLVGYSKKNIAASYLPSLVAFGNYQYAWQHPEFAKLWTNAFNFPVSMVGVKLQVPIFDGFNKQSKCKQAEIQLRQLDLQSTQLERSLEAEHANVYAQFNDNMEVLSAQNANRDLAEKVYQQTFNEYKQGTASLTDLLTSDNERQNAQVQYLNALSSVLAADVAIRKANGTLLK